MSQAIPILGILGLLIPLWVLLWRDFAKGLAFAVLVCVSMTTFLRIETPGNLPELTLHRAVLLSLFVFWLRNPEARQRFREAPLLRQLKIWAAASLVSLLFTQTDFVQSLKRYLDFVLETCVFYLVAVTSLRTREDALRVMRAAWLGLVLVALLAMMEKWTGFNPVDRFLPNYAREEAAARDILATYQHRILLGTAMAMGLPLVFGWLQLPGIGRGARLVVWVSAGMLATACYFARSRGPWLGVMGGGLIMSWLASPGVRKKMVVLGVAGALALLARPGVWESIQGLSESTFETESHKGGTFLYRLELWKIAATEVTKSPLTFLFGYGPGAGRGLDFEWSLSYRDRDQRIESWDNHYAYDLFQSGVVGFVAALWLYGSAAFALFRFRRQTAGADRDLIVCLLASVMVLLFMRTNVLIFAKQLDYLFWALVAAGFALGTFPEAEPVSVGENAEAYPASQAGMSHATR